MIRVRRIPEQLEAFSLDQYSHLPSLEAFFALADDLHTTPISTKSPFEDSSNYWRISIPDRNGFMIHFYPSDRVVLRYPPASPSSTHTHKIVSRSYFEKNYEPT